jgi:hypothetical protein
LLLEILEAEDDDQSGAGRDGPAQIEGEAVEMEAVEAA